MRDAQCARSRLWLSQWFLVRPGVSPDTHIAHSGPLGKAHASGQSRQNRLRSGCIVGGSHKAVGDWCSRPLYSRAIPKRGDSLQWIAQTDQLSVLRIPEDQGKVSLQAFECSSAQMTVDREHQCRVIALTFT